MRRATHRMFGLVAAAATVAVVVWGFVIVGSPETRRVERLDERRLEDLQAIVNEMQSLVRDRNRNLLKRELFADLESLKTNARRRELSLDDPETGQRYGFRVVGPSSYEVCATFSLPRASTHEVFWNHPAGLHCWVIDALDPP